MSWLVGFGLTFALLAFFLLIRTFRCARHGRILRACGTCLSGVVSAALAGAAVLLAFSYYSYDRLISEATISTIQFSRTASDQFEARLMVAGERDRFYELRGDEWQLDARMVNWKPPATILGLDPIYRLERLSGRFSEIDRERNEIRTVHALSTKPHLDVWSLARRFPLLTPGIDAYYGTATYVPMADGARYEVSLSRDAMIARPVNEAAKRAVGGWKLAPE
jgi:hypothetical protein